jgi:hypothetical protein
MHRPPSATHPASAHAAVVWPVRVDREGKGGLTKKRARGPRWRRTGPGLYVPAELELTVEQRIVEAAALLPAFGAVTGWAALRWWGGAWFTGRAADLSPIDIELCCDYRRPQPGILVCEEGMDPSEMAVLDAVRVTDPVRSVCYSMRYAPSVRAAVRAFDMAAYNDLVSLAEVAAYAECHSGWTGIPQCREALPLCDENAWSPKEVDLRLDWQIEANRPRPLTNAPVFDLNGRHLGTPDLIDPVAGVYGEYDGTLHLAGAQRARDVQREAVFRAAGLEGVTALAGDRTDTLVDRIQAAYGRAQALPVERRKWTTDPPAWWTETRTVDQRRALTDAERQRLLALRLHVA